MTFLQDKSNVTSSSNYMSFTKNNFVSRTFYLLLIKWVKHGLSNLSNDADALTYVSNFIIFSKEGCVSKELKIFCSYHIVLNASQLKALNDPYMMEQTLVLGNLV